MVDNDDIDGNPTPSDGRNNHTQQSNRAKERGRKGQVKVAAALAKRGGV